MKRILSVFAIAVILITACQPKTKVVPVDTEAAKAAVSALFDLYNSAFIKKEASTLTTLLTENALACGTDPSEFWDKKQIADGWAQAFADTSLKISYTIDKREIRVSKDGNSAIVVEQFIIPFVSPKMSVRCIYLAVRENEKWLIDFVSWNCIPKNEDLAKLNKALE